MLIFWLVNLAARSFLQRLQSRFSQVFTVISQKSLRPFYACLQSFLQESLQSFLVGSLKLEMLTVISTKVFMFILRVLNLVVSAFDIWGGFD